MEIFFDILLDILAPILLMVLLGAVLRWKFQIDLGTLSKLNIYLFVPAFIFDKVSTSTLAGSQMMGIVTVTVVQVVTLGAIVLAIGRLFKVNKKTLAAIALAVMFYNSGNYGIPLAELAYQNRGAEVQAFVLMTQNLLNFTLGLAIAAAVVGGGVLGGIVRVFRLPMIPALVAALVARWYVNSGEGHQLPRAISETSRYLASGLVPIALVTLGAQLASNPRWPRWKPISLVLFLRLVLGPIQMAGVLWAFHWLGIEAMDLWPWPAELLIATAAVPTAVNTLLLTLELEGDAELAADCVFWTTVFSCLTITIWLIIVKSVFG